MVNIFACMLILLAVGLGPAGCAYQIRPEAPSAMPLTRAGALGLRVGVVEDAKALRGNMQWLRDGRDPRKVTDALRYSGLFREVEGVRPGQASGYDLIVEWSMDLRHHVGIFPFLPLCDPLILGCFLDNHDWSRASIQASVTDGYGKRVKDYAEEQRVDLTYKIGALNRRQDNMRSAVENAIANLITAFIKDRDFYRGLKPGSGPASQPALRSAPQAAAEEPAAPAPAAAPEPALAEVKPAPRVRSEEEKARLQYEIDNLRP